MNQRTGAGAVLAGRYRLGESIGSGGMGKVWRAHDEVLHRTVAVKELTAGLYVAEADRAVLHARTQKEARAAARIAHPAVVTVHDVLEHDDRPWIVMEYIDGPSLADAAKAAGRIEPREAARIGLHVLRALRAAHAVGVFHRDVKPGNVLLAKDGRVLLTDFGIAAIEGDTSITRTGELVGSIDYLAPERVTGGAPAPASDLWSLGATLYTAVEARSPFRRTSPISSLQAVVHEDPPPPRQAGALGAVITALLRKDPADRPSAAEAEQMLIEAMEGREPRSAHAFVPTRRFGPEHAVAAGHGGGVPAAQGAPHHAGHPGHSGHPAHHPGQVPHGIPAQPGPHPAPPYQQAAPHRSAGRIRRAAAVAVVAALVGGGIAFGFLKYYGNGDGKDGGDGGRTAAGGSTGRAAGAVPAGWRQVQDPAGFSLWLPDGWQRRTDKGQIDYTPDDGRHRLRISVDRTPDFPTPYAHLLDVEKSVRKRLPQYERRALNANTFRGLSEAGIWEFTWTEKKDFPGKRRAVDQMYVSSGGTEYAIYMTGPAADWDTTRAQFDTVLRGWQAP
ncbi:protein kinase [Streptomyces bambusae]|nr:serine/threonine-protein kinase [Streptomyces bambusae]MCB5165891.1 protein kinase [Streptomyces bambusae]